MKYYSKRIKKESVQKKSNQSLLDACYIRQANSPGGWQDTVKSLIVNYNNEKLWFVSNSLTFDLCLENGFFVNATARLEST